MGKAVFIILLLNFIIQLSNGARILGIVPTPSYSHQIVFQPLWRELSQRGHQLTVLTTDPMKDPSLVNLTEIDLHFSYELWNKNVLSMITNNQESVIKAIDVMVSTIIAITEQQLQHPPVHALIKNESEHFDLLIAEFLMPTMLAFSERFKCPFIGMTSLEAPINAYEGIGNPTHPILYPDVMLPFEGSLSFIERLAAVFFYVFGEVYSALYIYPIEQQTVEKHFGSGYPTMRDLEKKVSMLFVNSDPIFHKIRPLVPGVVQIGGGSHRKPSKPLPKDLKKLLDSASQGFIYFSLGTNVKSKDLPDSTTKVLLETFAELPYLVLWKFELEDLPGKPANVKIAKWFPQQDVFKHPNIKLFITQGGLQSMDEAIYDHIPILGMPFFADQPVNIQRMVSKGMGLSVDHTALEKESFKEAILEVIDNPKYRNQIKKLATLATDQPMTGLEKAVWWTEYVLRHKGANHLRSPALDIPTYQYLLLDVIGFCVAVILVFIYLLVKGIKLVFKSLKLVKQLIFKPKAKVE